MNETKQVSVEFLRIVATLATDERWPERFPMCWEVIETAIAAAPATDHPAHTHCANCGCTWLDNGLNPAWCPYCKAAEPSEVAGGEIERLRGIEARYNELLYAVTDKQEGRTRHETALGYIQAVDNIGSYHKSYQAEKAS